MAEVRRVAGDGDALCAGGFEQRHVQHEKFEQVTVPRVGMRAVGKGRMAQDDGVEVVLVAFGVGVRHELSVEQRRRGRSHPA